MSVTKDYQTLNLELEKILDKLQQPTIRVDEAVELYEKGLVLVSALEKHLGEAENKIERLKLTAIKENM